MNKAQKLFAKHWKIKTGREVDDLTLHHMQYCVDAINEALQTPEKTLNQRIAQLDLELSNNFKAPYRLGEKQKRAILDSTGHTVMVLEPNQEPIAQIIVDLLNS